MAQEMMTTFDAENSETGLFEGVNEFGAGTARSPAHAAMVTR